jgi:hypothetical protein
MLAPEERQVTSPWTPSLYKNRSLSGFGIRLGSQLFTLLGYCCIQCSNLVKSEITMADNVQ